MMHLLALCLGVHIDYSSSAGVQQPQSPPTVQPQVPQLLMFSKDMSDKQLSKWLKNHPSLTGTNYEEDITKLRGDVCKI